MSKNHKNIIAALFVLSLVVLASTKSKSQDVPNYLFLEVIDAKNEPVKDAVVQMAKFDHETKRRSREYGDAGQKTDANGTVRFQLGHIFNDFTRSLFKISKPGYFDFFDLGVPMRPREQKEVKIELLKIPETIAEKKALGNEQFKREFFWAAKRGEAETVRQFLRKGFNPNLSTDDLRGVSEPKNISVILFAAASGGARTIKTLLTAGARVRAKDEPLHSVLAYYLMANPGFQHKLQTETERKKMVDEYQEGIKSLIKAGAAANDLLSMKGFTALMIAARQNDAESAELLIKLGVPVNYNIEGYTALINAVDQYGNNRAGYTPIKVVEVLLKAGADPNIAVNPPTRSNCRSVLMQSVFSGDLDMVRLLIKYKADVNFTCQNGDTALKWAKRYLWGNTQKQQAMIKLLEAAGAKE